MGTLAKVFIVIQAMLVMTYLGTTSTLYQHKKDWRDSYQVLKDRYGKLEKRARGHIVNLRKTIEERDETYANKVKDLIKEKKKLDNTLKNYQEESLSLARKISEYNSLEQDKRRLVDSNDSVNREISQIDDRIQDLETNLADATTKRRTAEQQVARLMTMKYTHEGDLSDLRKDYVNTRKGLRDKELLISLAEERGVNFATLLEGPPVPLVRGSVRAVKADVDPALILIDVGSNDKVESGFHFSVYRGGSFVGKLLVERVEQDAAACRVHFVSEGQTVQVGDSVTTRLP